MERIAVQTNVLKANQEAALENRLSFEREGLLVMNLMSGPGAGKTSLLEATIQALRGQCQIGVIEGDLQTDLDAERIRALGVRAFQINTGTMCHLDARMISRALQQFPFDDLDLLVIENVGNLICPASYDLGESLRVVLCSVAEGPEKPKKYPVMFHKADVILLNKIDLGMPSGEDQRELEKNVRDVNPRAKVFAISCRTGEGLVAWTEWLTSAVAIQRPNRLTAS
jgi:hydrogenase nickel incorporation protein HypB